MEDKSKFGLVSIILLGLNGVIGSGVFLLPGNAYALVGSQSIWVYLFDTLLVSAIALCFAEVGGMFDKTGGAYLYSKEAFGEFVGFEVGIMKWAVGIIAWASMAVGFATALGAFWPAAATGTLKNIIAVTILVVLGIINILGIKIAKYLNNIVTIGKLIPLIFFVAVGIFFIKGGNFTSVKPITSNNFGNAVILVFYAFTGFEALAIAAGDMENPKKNVPIAIIVTIAVASIIYILAQVVSIGTLGASLGKSTAPIADATNVFVGGFGKTFVTLATLVSIGGINIAASFNTPRSGVALAEYGILPKTVSKENRFGSPSVAIIISVLIAIPLVISGSFVQLAVISVVSRFVQYIPTCLSVIVLRKRKDLETSFRVPFGYVLPIVAVLVSIWLLYNTWLQDIGKSLMNNRLLVGLGGLIIGIPLYFLFRNLEKNNSGVKVE
jgi:amino acid transporter